MADEKPVSAVGRTLFVRNLPLTTTNEKLEDIFGNIGPLKKCFVVKEKGKDICKGYGYVTFSLQDDASKAKTDVKIVGSRKVQIDFADKKSKRKQQIKNAKKPVKSALDSSEDEEEEEVEKDALKTLEEKSAEGKAEKSALPEDMKAVSQNNKRKVGILDLSDLPNGVSRADLDVYLKGTNKHMLNLKFPIKGQKGRASVMFTNKATAMNALMLIKNRTVKGCKLKIDIKTQAPVVNLKKAKLIVRNLAFQCNEEKLRQVFSKFGELAEAIIPLRADGRKIGCGFVQFMQMSDAATAMKEMNAKDILGRPVAVDWALDREKYTTLSGANTAKVQDAPAKDVTSKTQESVSDSDESESSDDAPVNKKQSRVKRAVTKVQAESESSDESEGDISDDDDDDDVSDDDDESDADDDSESDYDDDHNDDEDDDDDVDNDDDDDEDDISSDEDEMPKTKKMAGPKRPGKNVLDEKKTVFIRNISFDTEEEELQEYLGQFGDIEYCRIVTDPNTEHSKGTAFVKFTAEESAAKCLEKANVVALRGDSGLVLDKRKLFVIPALPREKAEELRQPKKKEKEDRRNLYLVREGMIRPGTAAAEGLSKADLAKRMKVENVKRQKLKDGNVFVSKTRLCVRNIPPTVDDKALRKVYLKYVDDRNARITECRIMRDMGQVSAKGKAKSRGYAFVEFTQHEHALKALRNTNNNPEVFGENKRLIVEFSLENKKALETKQKRIERGKMKVAILKGEEASKSRYEKQATPPQGSKEIQSQAMSGVEAKKGVKGLPSHWGPKIRHKPRGNVKPGNKPKGKLSRDKAQKRKGPDVDIALPEGPTPAKKKRTRTRKPQKREQSDDFDSLVNKYKQKIMGKAGKRGTWGD